MGSVCGCGEGPAKLINDATAKDNKKKNDLKLLPVFSTRSKGKHPEELYAMQSKLGDGAFGTVKLAKNKKTGQEVAIKSIEKKSAKNLDVLENEIKINQAMDHPHIARMFEIFEDIKYIWIAMEVCGGGEMFDMIIENGYFSELDAAVLMEQVLRAICYMHHNCVAHRDLKPENFLLQKKRCPIKDNKVKVIDFGIAAVFKKGPDGQGINELKTKAGTPYYMAPEILPIRDLSIRYNEKCDVWSCGVILYILLTGSPPFAGETDKEILDRVKAGKIAFGVPEMKGVTKQAKEFISQCCQLKPAERFSAEQALNDRWIQNKSILHAEGKGDSALVSKLKAFTGVNRFKKAALNIIAHHVDDDMVKQLSQQFIAMDTNGDGELTIEEMKAGCKKAGLTNVEMVVKIFEQIDEDHSGSIGYSEFVAAMLENKSALKREQCWEAFRVFDQDGNGRISAEEFFAIMAQHGDSLSKGGPMDKGEMQKLFKDVDKDGDGSIDFEEFVAMMQA